MAESFSFISVYFRSSKGKGIVNGGGAQSEGGKTPDMPRGETRGGEYKKAQWHTTVYTLHSQACAVAPRQSDGIGGRKRRGGNPSSCLGAHLLLLLLLWFLYASLARIPAVRSAQSNWQFCVKTNYIAKKVWLSEHSALQQVGKNVFQGSLSSNQSSLFSLKLCTCRMCT